MTAEKQTELLDFAIAREQEAHDFYLGLARRMDRPGMTEIFTQFAGEELGHKARLESVKAGKRLLVPGAPVVDLKIADYTVDVDAKSDLDYQKALLLAMKREKASYKLYNDIADKTTDPELKTLFLALAQEEAKHKLRFEVEYDDAILTEN